MNAASGSMPHVVYILLWIAGRKVTLDSSYICVCVCVYIYIYLSIYIYIYIVMFLVVVEVYIGPASFHGAEKRKENKIAINKR
jgi:hypothetical protein